MGSARHAVLGHVCIDFDLIVARVNVLSDVSPAFQLLVIAFVPSLARCFLACSL